MENQAAAPLIVVFEEVRRHQGVDAAHVYGGLLAVLTAWCEEHGIPYQGVPVGTIKKNWTGKGNASKDQMMEEARSRGLNPVDDNEADALAIYDYAVAEFEGSKFLCLDLGTTTGYAVGDAGSLISGVWHLKAGRYEGGGMRFVKFRSRLNEILTAFPGVLSMKEAAE
jgi:hypothetical protein